MKTPSSLPAPPPWLRRRPVQVAGLILLLLLVFLVFRPARSSSGETAFHVVKRGDLTVSVVEGGTLSAVNEVIIRSEVEGTARIISIVPEGSYVKKGDLLVELDSSQAQDQFNQQQIAFEKAKFAVEQAKAQLEIQKSATNSDFLAADLKVQFARIDRDKYLEGQRNVDLVEASNKLVQAAATLAVNEDKYSNSVTLAAKGYETRLSMEGDRLTVIGNRNNLLVASNAIHMLQRYDVPKFIAKYNSDVLQAEQELDRVVNQNLRKMAQYQADLSAQINTLALSEQKMDRDRRNLTNTMIYAPQDGLVVYQVSENRFSSESLIEGGAVVRNRQELIKLPDLSRMKVVVKIHESHINMIRPGLPAFVRLDSMPDEQFRGVVEKVAPLPDTQARWGNPNLKVYNTEVYLVDALPNVKPGVSAKAEVIITNMPGVLSVPVQAVTSHKGKPAVYVVSGKRTEPRPVEVGLFNTKFIEIAKGLSEGERVMLAPPFDVQEKDLEGAVLADSEKAKAATNIPPRVTQTSANGAGPGSGRRDAGSDPGGGGRTPGGMGAGPGSEAAPAGAGAGGDTAGGPGGRTGGGRRGNFNPEEMLKQFDKNGDGQIDESEREAMRAAMAARFGGQGGPGGGPRMSREEMLKQFDKNGDGELDESERAAMRESLGGGRGSQRQGGGPGGGGPGGGPGGGAGFPRPEGGDGAPARPPGGSPEPGR